MKTILKYNKYKDELYFIYSIIFIWHQFFQINSTKTSHNSAIFITLSDFKTFFQKNLQNSQIFINDIWSNLK